MLKLQKTQTKSKAELFGFKEQFIKCIYHSLADWLYEENSADVHQFPAKSVSVVDHGRTLQYLSTL